MQQADRLNIPGLKEGYEWHLFPKNTYIIYFLKTKVISLPSLGDSFHFIKMVKLQK